MPLDPLTLAFYAFSRKKLKSNLAKAEKEKLKPVNYVMTKDGLQERDENNKNDPLAMIRVGNTLQQVQFTKPAVTDPVTKTPLTIDEYKAKFEGEGEVGLTDSEIIIPPITGQFKYSGGFRSFEPSKTQAVKSQKVGGTVAIQNKDGSKVNAFMTANTIPEFTSMYGVFPQLKIDYEGTNIVNRSKLELPTSSGKGEGLNAKDKKLNIPIIIPFKDTDGKMGQVAMNLYSVNTSASSQAIDLNVQIQGLLPFLKDQKDILVKNKTKTLVSALSPVLVKAYREQGVGEDSLSAAELIQDPVVFVKGFKNLAQIPGLKTDFLISLGVVAEEQRIATENKFKEEYSLLGQKIKIGEAKTTLRNGSQAKVKTVDVIPNKKNDEEVIDKVTGYLSTGAEKLEANALTGFIMKYQRDPVTNALLTDGNNAKIPLPNSQQNRLMFYKEMVNNPVAGAAGTEFNAWNVLVLPKGSSMFAIGNNDRKRLTGHFISTIVSPEGYMGGHEVIKAHYLAQRKPNNIDKISLNNAVFSIYQKKFPTQLTGKNAQNYLAEAIVKKNSAAEAIVLMRRALATYINPDGSFRKLSNFEGQVLIGLDGIIYFGKRMANYAGKLLSDDSSPETVSGVKTRPEPIDITKLSREQFLSKFDEFDRDDKTLRLRGKDTSSFDYRRGELEKTYRQITGENVDEATRNAAIRRYYRYMIAYQMAAAIQGGTGGRTISDQDVDNILRALGGGDATGTALSSPQTERTALRVAIQTMQDIYSFNKHISSEDEADRYAALKYQELVAEADTTQYISPLVLTGDNVAAIIKSGAGTDSNFSSKSQIQFKGLKDFTEKTNISTDTILKDMNTLRTIKLQGPVKNMKELLDSFQSQDGEPLTEKDLEMMLIDTYLKFAPKVGS